MGCHQEYGMKRMYIGGKIDAIVIYRVCD